MRSLRGPLSGRCHGSRRAASGVIAHEQCRSPNNRRASTRPPAALPWRSAAAHPAERQTGPGGPEDPQHQEWRGINVPALMGRPESQPPSPGESIGQDEEGRGGVAGQASEQDSAALMPSARTLFLCRPRCSLHGHRHGQSQRQHRQPETPAWGVPDHPTRHRQHAHD